MADNLITITVNGDGDAGAFITDVGEKVDYMGERTSKATDKMRGMGKAAKGASPALRNASLQLSQVAQQTMATGNFMGALAIQLPDLALGFGTIGIAAGVLGGVLLQTLGPAISSLIGQSEDLTKALERLEDQTSDLRRINGLLHQDIQDTVDTYGAYTEQVLRAAQAEAQIEIGRMRKEFEGLAISIDASASKYNLFAREMNRTEARQARLNKVIDAFQITGEDAEATAFKLSQTLNEIEAASNFEQAQSAMQSLLDLSESAGLNLSLLPDELQEAVIQMIALNREMAEGETIAAMLADAMGRGPIFGPFLPPGMETHDDKPKRKKGSGQDAIQRRLDRLRESFMTERELTVAKYAEDQDLLEQALAKQLVTRQEYAALNEQLRGQHNQKLTDLDTGMYRDQLRDSASAFQSLQQSFTGHNETMARLAAAGNAAVGLANSYLAFTEVLKDPALPWYARIPAAAGVLAAGLNAVTAIRGSGSGAGGGAGGGAAAASASQGSQGPLQVGISSIDPNALFTGEALQNLFISLMDVAGDRGIAFPRTT